MFRSNSHSVFTISTLHNSAKHLLEPRWVSPLESRFPIFWHLPLIYHRQLGVPMRSGVGGRGSGSGGADLQQVQVRVAQGRRAAGPQGRPQTLSRVTQSPETWSGRGQMREVSGRDKGGEAAREQARGGGGDFS